MRSSRRSAFRSVGVVGSVFISGLVLGHVEPVVLLILLEVEPRRTALELERKAYAWLRSTHDYAEGVTSFLEKRPPKYTGR